MNRSRRWRSSLLAIAVVFVVAAGIAAVPALAGAGGSHASSGLPPRVRPLAPGAPAAPAFNLPSGTPTTTVGKATRLGFCGGDDWEPEITSDALHHVYVVWSHYPGDVACDPASGNANRVYVQVSKDDGRTFGRPHVVSDQPGGLDYPRQVDNVVAVSGSGTVYVSFLAYGLPHSGTDVIVARSTDFGATFTGVKVNGPFCTGCDHPWIVAGGGQVYATYDQARRHFLSRSSDGGLTWTESVIAKANAVGFPEGGVMDATGNAYFAWADCRTDDCTGTNAGVYSVSVTIAGTSKTRFFKVASTPGGPPCPYDPDCGFAYFGVQDDIAIDSAGTLYLVWQDGQDHSVDGSPPIVQLSRSSDGGHTWTYIGRVDDKSASGCAGSSCYALFPRIEAGAPGHLGVMWKDDRFGSPIDHKNGWNVWLRTSNDAGGTWTGPSRRVSGYDPRLPESKPNGFLFPYGDYQGIDLTPSGRIAMIWGQGTSYAGGPTLPGHVVFRSMPRRG